jgi:N-acyl-D-aspartate/D-glutamate deacylase
MLDVLIAGGDVYDGTGGEPVRADVGVLGDRLAVVGRGLARAGRPPVTRSARGRRQLAGPFPHLRPHLTRGAARLRSQPLLSRLR